MSNDLGRGAVTFQDGSRYSRSGKLFKHFEYMSYDYLLLVLFKVHIIFFVVK